MGMRSAEVSRMQVFQLLTAQLCIAVNEKCAREMAWRTADLNRHGQPRSNGLLGCGGEQAMKTSP